MIGWLKIQTFLGPVLAVILLALGIGLLMKKPWARSNAVNFGYVQIVLVIIGAIVTAIGFWGGSRSSDSTAQAMAIGGMVGAVMGALFGSIYPILTIIFMSRPNVKAALAR